MRSMQGAWGASGGIDFVYRRRQGVAMRSFLLLLLLLCPFCPRLLAQPPSPYGVHSHVTRADEYEFTDEEFRLMQEAKIEWLRTGFVWRAIMAPDGSFDYTKHDSVVEKAEAAGIRILGLLHGAPEWAEPIHLHHEPWLRFVRSTVARYRDGVSAWQIWNEPNIEKFWKDPDPDHYAALLRETHRVIEEEVPGATVVFGATSQADWPFIERVLQLAPDSFDVMAVHPYGYDNPRVPEVYIPGTLAELRSLMSRHGSGNRPVWFTEWGWPTHEGRRGVTEREQAEFIVRAHLMAFAAGLERGFWYELQATERKSDHNEDHFGILHRDLSAKPAFNALATLIRLRPAGSEPLDRPYHKNLCYYPGWVRPDGVTVHAIYDVYGRWAKTRPQGIRFEGEFVEARGLFGNRLDLKADTEQGRITVPTPLRSPVYLIGPENIELFDVPATGEAP